jgi:hypothetical protein
MKDSTKGTEQMISSNIWVCCYHNADGSAAAAAVAQRPQLYLISLAVFEGVHIKPMAHQHCLFSLDEGQSCRLLHASGLGIDTVTDERPADARRIGTLADQRRTVVQPPRATSFAAWRPLPTQTRITSPLLRV